MAHRKNLLLFSWTTYSLYFQKLSHNRERFNVIQDNLRNEDQNYLYVWLVLYILRLWGSARSMMVLAGADSTDAGSKISNVFMYMQAIGDPGQAFCNFILFCVLDKTVRDHTFHTCCDSRRTGSLPDERTSLVRDESDYYTSDNDYTSSLSGSRVRSVSASSGWVRSVLRRSDKVGQYNSTTDKDTSVQSKGSTDSS